MDVSQPYALGTSAYLALQSLPLLFTPKLLVTLCAAEPRRITDLEIYLARSLALVLLTLSSQTLLLTGIIPLSGADPSEDGENTGRKNIYARPTVIVTTIYHGLSAFYLYTQVAYGWNFAYAAGMAVSTSLFCVGMWVILFGDERARLSKTGADKRTSNFPFENKESAREKKKEEKEKDKEGKTKRRSVLRSSSGK